MEVSTKTPKETEKIGSELGKSLNGGETIALYGDLGAGKTVFIKGLAEGLGIKKRILSPTFVFIRSYQFKKGKKDLTLHHLDLYRGENISDFEALGLPEIFLDSTIVVIEWAQRIKENLPKNRIDVFIERINENERRITITRS